MQSPSPFASENIRRMQQLADQAHAHHAMAHAIDKVLAYARQHAEYRAELWQPDARGSYSLEAFLAAFPTRALFAAESELMDLDAELPPPTLDLRILLVAPRWVATAAGAVDLTGPDWELVNAAAGLGSVGRTPVVDHIIALAASGRRPSLLRLDWQWCGVFPFATPAYERLPRPGFTGGGDGQAAA